MGKDSCGNGLISLLLCQVVVLSVNECDGTESVSVFAAAFVHYNVHKCAQIAGLC